MAAEKTVQDERIVLCTPQLREAVLAEYPLLLERIDFFRFVALLLFPLETLKPTGRAVINGPMIAKCMGKSKQYASKNLKGPNSTGAFLSSIKSELLPEFFPSRYHSKSGTPRTVKRTGLPAHIEQLRDDSLREKPDNLVDLVTGRHLSAKDITLMYEAWFEKARTDSEGYPETVRDLQDLLNARTTTPRKSFSDVRKHFHKASKVIVENYEGVDQRVFLSSLQYIYHFTKPVYEVKDRSPRIYPKSPALGTIPSSVRRALASGWSEYDLKSAGIATAAMLWDMPLLSSHLKKGDDVYQLLADYLGTEEALRKVVKKALIPVLYGSPPHRWEWHFYKAYSKHLNWNWQALVKQGRFLEHPLFVELTTAATGALSEIKQAGGAVNAFGNFVEMSKKPKVSKRSVLSQVVQSYETLLLEPVVHLAREEAEREKPRWRIMIWQYDGFSVRRHSRFSVERLDAILLPAVEKRAKELGVATRLVRDTIY